MESAKPVVKHTMEETNKQLPPQRMGSYYILFILKFLHIEKHFPLICIEEASGYCSGQPSPKIKS